MNLTPQQIKDLGRVAVLMGGCSAEREVSLRSGQAVLEALLRAGVNAFGLDLGPDAVAQLLAEHQTSNQAGAASSTSAIISHTTTGFPAPKIDRAFIALHGRGGEDGSIQGVLEWLGIPYTGSGVLASAVGMDKYQCKQIWQGLGLPTPAAKLLTPTTQAEEVSAELGLPLMIKPAHEGSSLGMSKITSNQNYAAAFAQASKYDSRIMAESFISGPEFTASIVNGQALPLIGLKTSHDFYDFSAKYSAQDTQYLLPCGLNPAQEQKLQELALQAYLAIGCEGWGRVDLMLDQQGQPWLLEVNTSPGMTNHSLVPQAAAHAGISFEQLVVELVAQASLKVFRV